MNYPNFYPYPNYYQNQPYNQRQEFPQYQQQMQQQANQSNNIGQAPIQGISPASRPVANREEANAVSADFSGAPMIFPDTSHDRIYVKRWNFNTGAADFSEYERVKPTHEKDEKTDENLYESFASREDFQDLRDIVENLKSEIDKIKKSNGKAVKKNGSDE